MRKVFIGVAVLTLLMSGSNVYAVDDSALLLSDQQIAMVRHNCVPAQAGLERIHATDGLLRVNLVQQFESISSRLMTPMNGRIAVNKLDGIELAKTTVDFNKEINTFRTRYQDYEQTVASAIQINCADQPVDFYDTVVSARNKRSSVRESFVKLQGYVKQYSDQFSVFSAKLQMTQKSGGRNGS